MKYVFIALAILLVLGLAARFLRARTARPPSIMPFDQLRDDIIQSTAPHDEASTQLPKPPPTRPPNLDTRLDATSRQDFDNSYPATEANWKAYFPAYLKVVTSVHEELTAIDPKQRWFELLSPTRRAVFVLDWFEGEVYNGGFDQFYINSAGDSAIFIEEALRLINRPDALAIVQAANAEFPNGPPRFRAQRVAQMQTLPESARLKWHDLDNQFYKLTFPHGGLAASLGGQLIHDNPDQFFKP